MSWNGYLGFLLMFTKTVNCLIKFVPESARNHAGTDETVPLLLAARARTHTEPPNVIGEEKAHGPTGTQTQDLSQTVRALSSLSYRATRSTCDNWLKNVMSQLIKLKFYYHFWWISDEFLLKVPKLAEMGIYVLKWVPRIFVDVYKNC